MQKRTNPLELKSDAKAAAKVLTPPPVEEKAKVVPEDEAHKKVEKVEKVELTAAPKEVEVKKENAAPKAATPPAEKTPEEVFEQSRPTIRKKIEQPLSLQPDKEPAHEPIVVENAAPEATPMSTSVQWQRVAPRPQAAAPVAPAQPKAPAAPSVEPEKKITYSSPIPPAAPAPKESEIIDELLDDTVEDVAEDVRPMEQPHAAVAEPLAMADEPAAEPTGLIEDEEELLLEDFRMAARFAMKGSVSRRMTTVKLSRDLCRLAQLMHPDQKLSTILENALLTRVFLENREAFDAMVEALDKKGGHIKC